MLGRGKFRAKRDYLKSIYAIYPLKIFQNGVLVNNMPLNLF